MKDSIAIMDVGGLAGLVSMGVVKFIEQMGKDPKEKLTDQQIFELKFVIKDKIDSAMQGRVRGYDPNFLLIGEHKAITDSFYDDVAEVEQEANG